MCDDYDETKDIFHLVRDGERGAEDWKCMLNEGEDYRRALLAIEAEGDTRARKMARAALGETQS